MKYVIMMLTFLIPSAAFAGSSSVDQSRITVQGVSGAVVSSRVRVTNTDTISQRYELSAPEMLKERVSMNPAQFTLAPGESKDVALRFRMPEHSQKTHLALIASDSRQHSALKVASGIRLPLELIISQVAGAQTDRTSPPILVVPSNPWPQVVYAIDGLLLIAAARLVYRRRLVVSRDRNYKISFV